jgi:hypothetical protein
MLAEAILSRSLPGRLSPSNPRKSTPLNKGALLADLGRRLDEFDLACMGPWSEGGLIDPIDRVWEPQWISYEMARWHRPIFTACADYCGCIAEEDLFTPSIGGAGGAVTERSVKYRFCLTGTQRRIDGARSLYEGLHEAVRKINRKQQREYRSIDRSLADRQFRIELSRSVATAIDQEYAKRRSEGVSVAACGYISPELISLYDLLNEERIHEAQWRGHPRPIGSDHFRRYVERRV